MVAMVTRIDVVTGCSCMQGHPQTHFCEADFVMIVRLRGEGEVIYKKEKVEMFNTTVSKNQVTIQRYPVDMKYNVNILKVFKVNNNTFGFSKNSTVAEIHTGPNEAMCGITLAQRTKYLTAGYYYDGQLMISLCGWNTPWAWVSKIQKKGLRSIYEKNCDCSAMNARFVSHKDVDVKLGDNTCTWEPSRRDGECYERHSACVHDTNSSTGGCKWHRNQRLKQCREESKSGRSEP